MTLTQSAVMFSMLRSAHVECSCKFSTQFTSMLLCIVRMHLRISHVKLRLQARYVILCDGQRGLRLQGLQCRGVCAQLGDRRVGNAVLFFEPLEQLLVRLHDDAADRARSHCNSL